MHGTVDLAANTSIKNYLLNYELIENEQVNLFIP